MKSKATAQTPKPARPKRAPPSAVHNTGSAAQKAISSRAKAIFKDAQPGGETSPVDGGAGVRREARALFWMGWKLSHIAEHLGVPRGTLHGWCKAEKWQDTPAAQRVEYALEGSIAVTGSLIQWLRDNLGMISSAAEVEELAKSVDDNGGAYFVPAFSGLFAPYWKSDARGALVGLTRYVNKGHIARAVLEATAFQTREVLDAMNADSGVELTELKVDGGMTASDWTIQFLADILGADGKNIAIYHRSPLRSASR